MPAEYAARARELLLADDWDPPVARPAATVALLRDGSGGVETFLLRRVSTMAFAAGMHVFPGGRVDAGDSAAVPWCDGAQLSRGHLEFAEDAELATALVVAAVRETFEETGVLLARDRDGELLRSRPAQWEEGRLAVLARTSTFADVLSDLGGFLDPALVPAWAHWVTPEIEPRRYDTRFFVAWLPPGQATVSVGGEADEVFWTTPAAAVARFGQGSLDLLPPTHAVLASLAEYVTASDVLAASESRRIRPTLPRAVLAGAGVAWELVDARTGEAIGPGDGTPP